MKKILQFLFFGAISQVSFGQINGTVSSENKLPLDGAIVSLIDNSNQKLLKTTFTDEKGIFQFEKIANGKYQIVVENTAFITHKSEVFELKNDISRVENIILKNALTQLKEVTIQSKTPFIERKIDKTVVNVEARLDNAGANVLETLEKSPGVLVTTDGAISLKGKAGVMIYIDDKPTYLAGEALQNYLRSLPANSIKQIEIITNPSAKYDAAGNAGIINIVTKRSKAQGLFGSFAVNANRGIYFRSNNSLNLNYNSKKVGFYTNISGGLSNTYQDLFINRIYKNKNNIDSAFFNQNSIILNKGRPINLKSGIDFYLTEKTTVGLVAKAAYNYMDKKVDNTSLISNQSKIAQSSVRADNQQDMKNRNLAFNANLRQKIDTTGQAITFDADYVIYRNDNEQVFLNTIFNPVNAQTSSKDQLDGNLPSRLKIYTFKTDYTKPLSKKTTLEAGLKIAYTNTNNTAEYVDVVGNSRNVNFDLSNQFIYKEYINAAYCNYNTQWNRWQIQSGLRYENTIMRGRQIGNAQQAGSDFKNDYNSLFPTLFAQYQLDSLGKHNLGFSYGRRIDRPNFDFLNPFVSPLDKFTFYTGNPFLVPTFSHNFALTYNIFSLNYSVSRDNIVETLEIDHNGKYFSRPNNLNSNQGLSIDATIPITITKKIKSNVYAEVGRTKIKSPLYTEQVDWARNYFVAQGNIQWQMPKNMLMEISGNYQSNMIYSQLLIKNWGMINFSLQKKIMKQKGSLRLSINDIFWTRRGSGIINNLRSVEANWNSKLDTRNVGLTFSYNFGKTVKGKEKYKGSGSESEQQRAQK